MYVTYMAHADFKTFIFLYFFAATPKPITGIHVVNDSVAEFSVGERVWVNGNKPGYVQFIGVTQFAPGQWAGIVLDEAIGKNDGSVAGVRYFQCQDLRGIFTRPSKLSRTPVPERATNGAQPLSGKVASAVNAAADSQAATASKTSTNLTTVASESAANLSETDSAKKGKRELKIGDRVLVRMYKKQIVFWSRDLLKNHKPLQPEYILNISLHS